MSKGKAYSGKYKKFWDDEYKNFNTVTLEEVAKLIKREKTTIVTMIAKRSPWQRMEFGRRYGSENLKAVDGVQLEIMEVESLT